MTSKNGLTNEVYLTLSVQWKIEINQSYTNWTTLIFNITYS
jgi:hypothetical protein